MRDKQYNQTDPRRPITAFRHLQPRLLWSQSPMVSKFNGPKAPQSQIPNVLKIHGPMSRGPKVPRCETQMVPKSLHPKSAWSQNKNKCLKFPLSHFPKCHGPEVPWSQSATTTKTQGLTIP